MLKLENIRTPAKTKVAAASSGNIFNTQIKFGSPFNNAFKEKLYNQLCILLKSGMDMMFTFDLILKQEQHETRRAVFGKVIQSLRQGHSLSEAWENIPGVQEFERNCLRIGEETGSLVQVCDQLKNYYAFRVKLRRLVLQSVTYPLLIVCTAFFAVLFMLAYIVPMFEQVYHRFNSDLPFITLLVILEIPRKLYPFFRANVVH